MQSKKIAEANEMLSGGTMSSIDLINRVRHNNDDLCNNLDLSQDNAEAVEADDETELGRYIEAELISAENELDEDVEIPQPMSQGIVDDLPDLPVREDTPEPLEGACVICLTLT